MNSNNELAEIAKQSGLAPNKTEELMRSFSTYFDQARTIVEATKDIVVTDESQGDLMLKAREGRLELKKIRCEVEETRKTLKEQSLREGRAIDGVSNIIKALIVPVEEHLEKQEKYAETKELERIANRYADRVARLSPFVDDISLYTVKDMTDEAFEKLLESSMAARKAQKDAEAKAEKERIAKEKAAAEEQERVRQENIRLTEEAKKKDAAIAEEKRKNDEIIAEERRKREAAELKLKQEKEAQEKKEKEAKDAEAAKVAAAEEAKRKALLAPDKEKLVSLSATIDTLTLPSVASREAGLIIEEVRSRLTAVSNYLREKAQTL